VKAPESSFGKDLEQLLPTCRRLARFLRLGHDHERIARVLACLAMAVREARAPRTLTAPVAEGDAIHPDA
jgi:hypothetical protein